jgi:putative aldouronate transport system permease protein
MTTFIRSWRAGKSRDDRIFDIVNIAILSGALLLVLYPLYIVVIASISSPDRIYAGEVWLYPRDITLEGYQRIFRDPSIWLGFRNSALYAILGTAISVALILTGGYALSRKDLYGRNVLTIFFVATLFFDGGLIPRYLLVRDLHMLNTVWAVVLPGAVGVWNLIIARTFFETTIPDELREAAFIDGATNLQFFWKIVLPLSLPLIAVMVLIHVVGNWNAFFDALIYLTDENLYPLQLILRNIVTQSNVAAQSSMLTDIGSYAAQQRVAELIKYGMIVVASAPLLIFYPFLQKYFVKGLTIGAIKG